MTLLSTAQGWWRKKQSVNNIDALSDDELLQNFATRSEAKFIEELMQRHNKALYPFLVALSDTHTAEDIAQQTWLKLIEQPLRYTKTNAGFRTWLFTVARNRLFDTLRQARHWQWDTLEETTEAELPFYNDDLEFTAQSHIQNKFNQALLTLPFVQREAISLQLEGFSLAELAAITNEKPETIKSRLRFARKNLKQTLEQTA
jgi:RNA polymerase sigma-70 factor (ECF subfamily)